MRRCEIGIVETLTKYETTEGEKLKLVACPAVQWRHVRVVIIKLLPISFWNSCQEKQSSSVQMFIGPMFVSMVSSR